jgi:hypothetical protein
VDAGELLRSDASFVADTSAWWRVASLPTELRALVSNAILEERFWITPIVRSQAPDQRAARDYVSFRAYALALVRVAGRSSQAGRVVRLIEGTDELIEVRGREDGRCPFREQPIFLRRHWTSFVRTRG